MDLYRCLEATREIHRLRKKYRDIVDYITPFERLLSKDMRSAHQQYPGLGLTRPAGPASIWKARVVYPPLGGASSGLRYVYERLDIEGEIVIVALKVYVHQSGIKESDVINDIRSRSGAILPSRDELSTLEKPDLSE